MNKGKIIVIEGTDGSGKTTQTELLLERLKKEGIATETLRFPMYRENLFGGLIRECQDGYHGDFLNLDPKVASVLYACDRHEAMPKIKAWLEEGKLIILDRYVSSNQIHQGGKIKEDRERAKFLEWLGDMEFEKLGNIRPDLVLYLDVPFEISKTLIENRTGVKDLADEDWQYLANSKAAGMYMTSKEDTWRRIECAPGGTLLPKEKIAEKIWGEIRSVIK